MSKNISTDQEEAQRRQRRLNRLSTWIVLAAIFILAGLTWLIVAMNASPIESLKQRVEAHHKLKVEMKVVDRYGEAVPVLRPGDELDIYITTTLPVYTAVVVYAGGRPPVVVFRGARVPPGENRHLSKADTPFRYQVASQDQNLKLCIIYGLSMQALEGYVAENINRQAASQNFACVEWHQWKMSAE